MAEQSEDKSQDATPHRRQEAREKGQVAQSQDLGSAVTLIGGLAALMILGGGIVEFLAVAARAQLSGESWKLGDFESTTLTGQLQETAFTLLFVLLPVLGAVFVVAVGTNLLQIGFLFLPQKLAPDIGRLNPIKGLGRIFSVSGMMRLLFGIFKILVIATVAFWSLYDRRNEILSLAALELLPMAAYLADVILWTGLKIGGALLLLAVLDYAYQRWKQEQDLKMSTQEVREEMKNMQGDPQVIARRRQVQRQLVLNRLASLIPKADVVITNPTQLAIAIQYDPQTMFAPIVLAKGAGVLAARIRRLALEHNVPIVEKKELARQLYKEVDINHPVPDRAYAAVAEVLAYVYQLKGKPVPGAGARQ